MNVEIEVLSQEIDAIQTEIANLQREEQKIFQKTPTKAASPHEMSLSIKAQAIADSQIQPKLNGIRDAVSALKRQLSHKQNQLVEARQEASKQQLQELCTQSEEKLVTIAEQINQASISLDELIKTFKSEGLAYNRLRSELERSVVYGVELSVPYLPSAVLSSRNNKFYLKVRFRPVGKLLQLNSTPEPLPKSSISEYLNRTADDTFIFKEGAGEAQLQALRLELSYTKPWSTEKIALINGQIKELENQIGASKEPVK